MKGTQLVLVYHTLLLTAALYAYLTGKVALPVENLLTVLSLFTLLIPMLVQVYSTSAGLAGSRLLAASMVLGTLYFLIWCYHQIATPNTLKVLAAIVLVGYLVLWVLEVSVQSRVTLTSKLKLTGAFAIAISPATAIGFHRASIAASFILLFILAKVAIAELQAKHLKSSSTPTLSLIALLLSALAFYSLKPISGVALFVFSIVLWRDFSSTHKNLALPLGLFLVSVTVAMDATGVVSLENTLLLLVLGLYLIVTGYTAPSN